MKKRFTFLIAVLALLSMMVLPGNAVGQTRGTVTYQQLQSIDDIDEDALYVLGIDGVGFHYSNTSNWGLTGLPADHDPYLYKLIVANDGNSFKAYVTQKIYGNTYYLQVHNSSNTFAMSTNSSADNTDLIIGTTQVSGTNYAIANKNTTNRHLRRNGASGLRSYAGTTGSMAFFYKVVTKLDTPSGFTATPGNEAISFTWESVTNASSYTISYTPTGGAEQTVDNITGTSTTISGLTNGTSYTCKIMAVGSGSYSNSDYSSTTTVTPSGATLYNINISSSLTGGSVSSNVLSAAAGAIITLTATPSSGHTFNNEASNWTSSPSVTFTPGANNTATFEMPASDVTVGATFAAMAVYYVSCTTPANGTLSVSPTSGYNGVEVTITATPNSGYELATLTATDSEGQITITDNKFSIRNSNVTVTAMFARAAEWILTDISELTSEDVFVIVGTNSGNYSMSNNNGTSNPPAATSVTILNEKITSSVTDNLKWNISGNASDGYTFYPNGSTTTWLYCTNTNNGVRIGDNGNKTFSLDEDNYLVHSGTSRILSKYSDQWRCYGNYENTPLVVSFYKRTVPSSVATPIFSVAEGTYNENQSVTITCATPGVAIYYTLDGTKPTSSSTAYTGAITIDETKTLKAIAIKDNEESYVASATYTMQCATPTFSVAEGTYTSVQSVTITSTGASIYYTLDGTTPTGSSTPYSGAISIDATKTLKAIAIKSNWENSAVASASYTIYLPLTTIDEIYASSATSGTYAITFDDWVVSGIQTGNPSKKAYVTDGEKGFTIYNSVGHGLSVGDILSGTVLCSLSRYNGSAQVSNISGTLNHNTGGEVTVANIALAELSGINTGALISYNDLSYDGTNLSDGNTNIKPFGDLTSLSDLFTSYKKYHVKGIYLQYSATKEIMPRSSADVVLAADMTATDFSDLTLFTYVYDENGTTTSAPQYIGIDGTDFAGKLTITVSDDYEISTSEEGSYINSIDVEEEDGEIAETLYVRLKAGLDADAHNGTLTFEASNLTTIVKNLEGMVTATQTYDIVINTPIANGSVVADVSVAEAGEIVTLTAIPDDCYQFTTWVTEPTVTWVSDNQFSMPEKDVLVSATFTQKTFVVTYSFNGDEIWTTSTITCGETTNLLDEDNLTTLEVVIPSGFYFQGWSEDEGSSTLVSSPYTPTATRTLYAVLTYGESEAYYAKVTSDLGTNWAGDYLIAYSSTIFADGRDGGTSENGIGYANQSIDLSDYISGNNIPAINGDTYKVTLVEISSGSNTYVLKTQDNKYNYHTNNTNNGLSANSNITIADDYPITVTFINENDIRLCLGGTAKGSVFRYNSGSNGDAFFRFYKNCGQNAVYLYKRTVSEAPNFNEVVNVDAIQEIKTDISENTCVIVENNGVLTFSGENQGTAANLIIKDGGQLKVYATDTKDGEVQATVEKNIIGYGNDDEVKDGWNFIASPINDVNDLAPTSVTNMTENNYDLYQLNNTSWENYKEYEGNANPGFNLTNGRGYLYANSNNVTLEFAGTVKPFVKDGENTVSVAAGWNLIGNPFTFNVYANRSYYKMNDARTGIEAVSEFSTSPIAPCTGIVVKSTGTDNVAFLETAGEWSTGNKGNIEMTLAQQATNRGNATTIDNAIVSFNEGSQLEKFYFGNPSASIFIPQNGEDYAIAFSDRQGDVPLYFKANETGTYTISFAGDEMSLNGIYLIDILAEEEIDLSVNPSYTFIGSPADRMARFKIVFRNANGDGTSDIFAYQNGNDIIVSGEGELQIFDVMGRMVSKQRVNGVETVNVKSQGVYIFRLNDKTQKIVVR